MTQDERAVLWRAPDGRCWSIEVLGPGKIKVTDIMSPNGYHEWISAEQAGITFHPTGELEIAQ